MRTLTSGLLACRRSRPRFPHKPRCCRPALCDTMMFAWLLLLLLLPLVFGRRYGKCFSGGNGVRGNPRRGKKIIAGTIDIVKPEMKMVKDTFDNPLGLMLNATGTGKTLKEFDVVFFFTPFQGTETFDGTCTFTMAKGDILNCAFFDHSIGLPMLMPLVWEAMEYTIEPLEMSRWPEPSSPVMTRPALAKHSSRSMEASSTGQGQGGECSSGFCWRQSLLIVLFSFRSLK